MARVAASPWPALLLLTGLTLTQGYYFEDGFDHHYTYSSETDLLGKKNITTVLKFEIRVLNTSEDGERLHSLHVNSLVQFAEGGFYHNNPKRWDLSKIFMFRTSVNGSITLVHVHPEDEDELVVIKKAMTSIFSVTVRDAVSAASSYEETESDHLGTLSHSYVVRKTQTGSTISRSHFSHDRAERTHTKTLHYDKDGTLHRCEAFDRIALKEKHARTNKPSVIMPGERRHNVTTSGDVPVIWTASRTHVRLDGKRSQVKQKRTDFHSGLKQETLQIKVAVVRRRVHEVSRNISIYLQCVHDHPEQGDVNRTDCVHNIREILMSLHKDDYREFGQSVLNKSCEDNMGRCYVERLVFIDITARIADDISQQLIVDHVLLKNNTDEEELRHVFIHCISIEKPLMNIIAAVESYCFGKDDEHHGSIKLTTTQSRACLAVGSLARNLHLNSNQTDAVRLVNKIHNWITQHETHSEYRHKRSLHFEKDNHYITSKVILIHSLGNAGHPQSLGKIISLTSPYQGHHDWRRAAVGALRHFTCNESANALLDSALRDKKESVRQAAKHMYLRHPRGANLTKEQENIILSHDYTWPVVARLRRSVLDIILFQFRVGLPTVDWKKEIGNSKIGASFGVYFENWIAGAFRPLTGFVDLSVYDKLWAEAHISIVGFRLDILLIEVCYKGRLEYNMNKFKDFSVGLVENIVGAYDDMAQQIMKPLTDATNKMSSHFLASDGKTSISNVEPLANAVKDIPAKMGIALDESVKLGELVQKYQNVPWIIRLKQVADQAQSLMEGANADALNFYKRVSDAAIIALPHAEKEVMDAINRGSQIMSKISKFPKQAFSDLEKTKLSFQLGMSRIFSSNSIIKEATSFLKGKSSSWMSVGRNIGDAVSSLRSVLTSASKTRSRKRRSPTPFDQVNDFLDRTSDTASEIFRKIEDQTNRVIQHMEGIRDKEPQAFQDGLDKGKQATLMLQHSFKVFQETLEKIKSTIQSLFGAKFHPAFPGQRRPKDNNCGKGIYPSGTRDKYKTAGIDLVLETGWKVVCPVAGLVSKTGPTEVVIQPTDADFQQYEIIIANIKSSVDTEANHYGQGEVIGTSLGNNGCEWPHIHLAVRTKTETAVGDDMCFYMDPSPFVDTLKLKPVWNQECKDFKFVHMHQVFDYKKIAESLKKMVPKLARSAINWVKDLAVKALQKLPIPTSVFENIPGFVNGILGKLGHLSDVSVLFKGVGTSMKNFFSAIDIKKMDFKALSGLLTSNALTKGVVPELEGLMARASTLLNKVPLGNLKSFATGGLGKHLAAFGLKALGGKLESQIQLKTSMFKVCPHFKEGFPFGLDRMCSVDDDCLGFTCHINIPYQRVNGGVDIKAKIDPDHAKIDVELNGEGQIAPKGDSVSKSGIKLGLFSINLKSSAQWEGGAVVLTLSLKPCYKEHCLKDVKIVRNLKLHLRHKRRAFGGLKNRLSNMKTMGISKIRDQLANLNVRAHKFTQQMNRMKDGLRSKISKVGEKISENMAKKADSNLVDEIASNDEYEDKQDYPNGKPLYISFLPPWLREFHYPAGPVMFVISLDAGAELGQDITADVQAVKSTVTNTIAPFVVGKVKASMGISIVIASAGISLTGWLMRTKFPFILEVNYAQLPAAQTKKLLVELTPIELKLRGWVKILFFINLHFDIWHWKSPTLTGTIWKHTKYVDSNQPPRFPNCDSRKRSVSGSCSVRQIAGRHPGDTVFLLEVAAQDDSSTLTLHYSIGTARGGRDVRSQVEMRGPTLTVPTSSLPNGVPLYWTVTARNTQGKETTTSCMLPTYDNTLPDGRVDAAYPFTSHRTTIQGNVVVFEDSELRPQHEKAVGYSPGEFGKEEVEWDTLFLNKTSARQSVTTDLKHFSPSIKGKLSSHPFVSAHAEHDTECAMQCIKFGLKCVSFDYEMHTQTCDLQQTVRGPNAKLVTSGSYFHYERLGVGYSAFVEYSQLRIEHGAQYFVNAKITNVLNYTAYLPSSGTLADFTPPEPGPVGDRVSDVLTADECRAAVTQRCIDSNKELNHRNIIDGPGGKTIFNGNRPLLDRPATSANNYISGNCDGFHDDESGIWGYTWAAGTSVCGSDVVSFRDPHASLQTRADWTYTGLGKNLELPDGPYYITFQAINNVVHGGALVTTVCHSQPLTVDTTPPMVHEVGDLLFDEDFDILGVYFNVSDGGSGIARVDFGLGKTKYDVFVRSYSRHHFMTRDDPYLVIEDLGLAPGVQAWVRIRAVNSVELFTASHGDVPILIDFTPPVKGRVLDGEKIHQDIDYQHDVNKICAQWIDFYDAESGIDSYLWGVGTIKGLDNIIPFQNFTHRVKSGCRNTILHHNTTYYSTVIALNGALNQKDVNETSNGVLIDITPPSKGYVQDGPDVLDDIDFSSKTATIESSWANFTDPESHVPEYAISVYINDELKKVFEVGDDTSIADHTLSMKHLDKVRIDVMATNGAGLATRTTSNGYLVDETPPFMVYLTDSETGRYQNDMSYLRLSWYFTDDESGIARYKYTIFQKIGGIKKKFWPQDKPYEVSTSAKADIRLDPLSLTNGARYTVSVSAFNRALLVTKMESSGVIIDTTSPSLTKVIVSLPGEEEELDDHGNVVHIEGEPLHVSWTARDPESGIVHSLLCITDDAVKCTEDEQFVDYGTANSVTSAAASLVANVDVKYAIIVRVINGAGKTSEARSKPIVVEKGNSPGTIYDGRYFGQDENYQQDKSSLSMSFAGFDSEACGITGYDWGIGTEPYITDIMRFTNYGLTMLNDSAGYAETSNTNFDNVKYFVTVRAITGENCHESYIVSSSDGITVDREVPAITQQYEDAAIYKDTIFQNQTHSLPLSWTVNDESGFSSLSWSISNYPGVGKQQNFDISKTRLDPDDVSLVAKRSYFVTTFATDLAGNNAVLVSPPITIDSSPSLVKNFTCTPYMSVKKTIIECSWLFLEENESKIRKVTTYVGSSPNNQDIAVSDLSITDQSWSFDMEEITNTSSIPLMVYITLDLENEADLHNRVIKLVKTDPSPPTKGEVKVITSSNAFSRPGTFCQIPTSYVCLSFEGFTDDESGINRYEVGLGSKDGQTDILPFTAVRVVNGRSTLGDLHLQPSSLVYITIRVFNNAGLFSAQSGGTLAVSPRPYVTVLDGPGPEDVDSQHGLSVIQGRWMFSDACPVVSAEWAIMDITGEVVRDFQHTPGDGTLFYNDELVLNNLRTYTVTVRIVDQLNRTITGRSDGVMVQIQPPVPGHVRDGLESDINYQHPTDSLATNWDPFGDEGASEPSQQITHYDVAIGDDRRYEETRSNVHFYENVGLNTSYVFYHLNLTAKTKKYYITVRAYSAAGSFEASSSNGIRVGYEYEVQAGEVSINPFQSSTSSIRVTWSDFISDFDIRRYKVALHDSHYESDNGSIECDSLNFSPLVPFTSVNKNTIAVLDGLKLNHSEVYFIIVKAEDEAGNCIIATSGGITIDTTPPSVGDVSIEGGRSGGLMYARDTNALHVRMRGFEDEESLVDHFTVQLLGGAFCSGPQASMKFPSMDILQSVDVFNPEAHFNEISLGANRVYYIKVMAVNKAGLFTTVTSSAILMDLSPPASGNIKIGSFWEHSAKSWSNTHSLEGTIAVNLLPGKMSCDPQIEFLDIKKQNLMEVFGSPFDPDSVIFLHNGDIQIYAGLDSSLRFFQKGGIQTHSNQLTAGNYSFLLQAASGQSVSTIAALMQNGLPDPHSILDVLNKDFIENCTKSSCDVANYGDFDDGCWNAGLFFTTETNATEPLIIFWAKDRSKLKVHRVQLDFDPQIVPGDYTFQMHNTSTRSLDSWNIDLLVNGEFKGQHAGLDISGDMTVSVYTWNNDGYIPPVDDPFDPFSSSLLLSSLRLPRTQMSACRFGKMFSDSGSGIKDIYVGLSDSQNRTGNVSPYKKHKSFCIPCKSTCQLNCSFVNSCKTQEYVQTSIQTFTIGNLTLIPSTMADTVNYTDTEARAYYLDVKVTDHAGFTTEVKSDAVIIDTTPPVVTDVTCYDPDNSLYEPAPYVGNDHSVAASWEISEDFSEITAVYVGIGSTCGGEGVMKPVFEARLKKSTFNLTSTRFQHDHTYHVSVSALNSAGLKHTSCCNFTTDFRIPAAPPAIPKALYTSSETVPGLDVGISEYSDRVGMQWGDPASDVEYFEWDLVSEESETDIYPSIRVGSSSARLVKILKGDMYVENGSMVASVSEYLNRNFSDGLKSSDFSSESLSLEPGKCVSQTIKCVSRAHKKTSLSSQKTCVKRRKDMLLKPGKRTYLAFEGGEVKGVSERTDPKASTMSVKISKGGMLVGTLSPADLQMTYGAPAAADYSPFIVNPDITYTQLSRYLFGRFISFVGTTFYLSPVTDVHLEEDIQATLAAKDFSVRGTDEELSVIFWDSKNERWRHINEVCDHQDSQKQNLNADVFMICNKLFAKEKSDDPGRDRRAINVYPRPRMLSGAKLRSVISNTPPIIDTDIIHCLEETDILQKINYHDNEGDSLSFRVETPPQHGSANITSGGTLFYRPDKNFNGLDSVILKATEVFVHGLSVQPHHLNKCIVVNVSNVNDQPVSFFQQLSDKPVSSTAEPIHTVYLEGNLTDHALGAFWIADVDKSDNLHLLQKDTSGFPANFSLVQIPLTEEDETYKNLTDLYSKETISYHKLSLKTSTEYHGNVNFSIRAVDNTKSYSHRLTVEVFVLVNPCCYGTCAPTSNGPPCSHPTRAVTFDPYRCQCKAGYKGAFCEDEINECHLATCSLLYDCVDRLADYDCVLNIPKIIAIFMCILLPVAAVSFFIWRRCKKMKSHLKIRNFPDTSADTNFHPVFHPITTHKEGGESETVDGQNPQTSLEEDYQGHAEEVEGKQDEPQEAAADSPEVQQDTVGECPGTRPGYAPMPHRRGRQTTSGLYIPDPDMPRVED